MTTTEICTVIALASLIVERFASHATAKLKAEQWVRDTFSALVADYDARLDRCEAKHDECESKLSKLRSYIDDITPAQDSPPAE